VLITTRATPAGSVPAWHRELAVQNREAHAAVARKSR
jgi:hypothetical protein